jgi:quinol monooxygenase YgiN
MEHPVTELVLNPLRVPVKEFMRVFAEQLEPTLLAEPGAICTITGIVLDTENRQKPFAISMTLWENLEAHQAFLDSPAAQPFFEAVKPLLVDKPTIEHYHLGQLHPSVLKSSYAWIHKFSTVDHDTYSGACENHIQDHGKGMAMIGDCIEVPSQRLIVMFDNQLQSGSALDENGSLDQMETFRVSWQRMGTRKIAENL